MNYNWNAPPSYLEAVWQQILGSIAKAVGNCFARGQDVRLLNGERLSVKSSGGIEAFFTVDDNGSQMTPFAGGVYSKVDSGAALTISAPGHYVFAGTTATWTLPAVSASKNWLLRIKNRGSGALTVQRAGTDQIYDTSAVTSISIPAGSYRTLVNDGTYWDAQ